DMTGLTVQTRLRERGITLPVVMITAFADVPLAVAAMRAGAADFLEKPYSDDVLIASVHLALARAETIADIEEQAARTNARLAQLTPRERQVLDFLLVGRQNKQIAHDLGISPRTVEIHRARVMDKMQAGSLSELVRIVLTVRAR
ncbi:MAG: response regulator, partial [Rhodospirillales bacterium]|nr:response regulator [Rhodospirillales bacterium]